MSIRRWPPKAVRPSTRPSGSSRTSPTIAASCPAGSARIAASAAWACSGATKAGEDLLEVPVLRLDDLVSRTPVESEIAGPTQLRYITPFLGGLVRRGASDPRAAGLDENVTKHVGRS